MSGMAKDATLEARIRTLEDDNLRLRTSLAEAEARAATVGHGFLLRDGICLSEELLECRHTAVRGRVSVIIPAYNAAAFLERAVTSVWMQRYPATSIEILVVDDGSSDGTRELAARMAAASPVPMRVLTHEGGRNRGVAPTRQLGVREATGEFVALLDADDAFLPERLQATVAALMQNETAVAVCSLGRNVDSDGQTVIGHNGTATAGEWRTLPHEMTPPFTFEQLWRADPIANSSLTIRRSALEQVGGFPTLMAHQAEDWLVVLKLSLLSPILCLDRELMLYTHHPGAYTHAYHSSGLREGARLETLYHIAWWMLHSAAHEEAGAVFLRREYPRVVAEHQRFLPMLRQYYADGGRPAAGAAGLGEYIERLTSELETLRRTVRVKLHENKRLRLLLDTSSSPDASDAAASASASENLAYALLDGPGVRVDPREIGGNRA